MLCAHSMRIAVSAIVAASLTGLAVPAFAQVTGSAPATPPAPGSSSDAGFDQEVAAMVGVTGGLTADQAAARAPRVAPEVRAKLAEVAVATADAKSAELVRVPRLSGSLGYTRLSSVELPMLAPGFSFPVFLNSYAASAQLALPVSDYLLTFPNLIKAARAGSDAARHAERATRLEVAAQARVAYFEWARARLQGVVVRRQVAQVEAVRTQLVALVNAQRVSQADLLRVEAQKAQAEQGVAAIDALTALREQQLRLAIGAEPSEALAIGDDVRVAMAAPAVPPLDQLHAAAMSRRLDVRTLDAGIAALDLKRQAGKAAQYPRLGAFAQVEYSNPNQRIFPSQDQFDLTWAAGVQVTWNLNDNLVARVALERDLGEVDGLRAQRALLGHGVRLQLTQAITSVELAAKSLRAASAGLAAAEEGYRVRKLLLASERATAVEIVDAEVQLTQARFGMINAHIDLRIALVGLDHASGADVTAEAKP